MRLSGIVLALGLAQGAGAVEVTLGFDGGMAECDGVQAVGQVSYSIDNCTTLPFAYVYLGTTLVVTAEAGYAFDALVANMVYYDVEALRIAAEDVPDDIDPASWEGISALWIANLWEWLDAVPFALIEVTGSRDGAVVASWGEPFDGTFVYNDAIGYESSGLDIDPRDLPGLPMEGLDRLEISLGAILEGSDGAAVLIDGFWYSVPPGSSFNRLFFDDLRLDVYAIPTTTVPLPATGLLGLAGLAGLAALRRRRA